ncbi:polysaccharide deacetylase family protein [Haladaptatus sp. DYSN1]|uniref:polysaccharide deacetylase family protein n=1 Tax=unclassified Haladaptatus TaxID=2622732 RepID=UPI002406A0D5|nr:polysaccharide deacetylase family protein [Haladaptatus sp. DYSN1]
MIQLSPPADAATGRTEQTASGDASSADAPTFWLCLTHDVDRPYKGYQSLYYALKQRDPYHLRTLLPDVNPYWQFENIMALEESLGVRSAFYFLNEKRLFRDKPPREWLNPKSWQLYAGRYDIHDPAIVDVIRRLDEGGWEVGLHGSYDSYNDFDRLKHEKETLEAILGHEIVGGRQHYLNLEIPTTWEYHRELGLKYDASLGSSSEYGFDHGYDVQRPFDDEFVVFPLAYMENAIPDPGVDFEFAWHECKRVLDEAYENRAVMTILWHPMKFAARDFPGQRELYQRIIEYAQALGAWVGPPGDLYAQRSARFEAEVASGRARS